MKRIALGLAVGVAVIGVGLLLSRWNEPEPTTPQPTETSDAPDVAQMRCEDGGTTLLTRKIQVQETGIHFLIDNRDGARRYYFALKDESGHNNGGRLEPGINRIETDLPPGLLAVTCQYRPQRFDTHFVDLRVLDPKRLYIPADLSCEVPESSERTFPREDTSEHVPENPFGFVREHVSGLEPPDLIVKPGYVDTQWHSDTHVIARDGETIADVSVWAQGRSKWNLTVRSCEGSGIAAG